MPVTAQHGSGSPSGYVYTITEGISGGNSSNRFENEFRSGWSTMNPGFNGSDVNYSRISTAALTVNSDIAFRESLFDTPVGSDTVPHPRSVMFRSLILPGWGQVTNRQIWKVPVVYALLGGLTYYSIYSHGMYTDYRAAYYNIATGNDDFRFGPTPPRLAGVPPESLRDTRNFFRNRRDFTFILIGLAYGLNVLDAYIFAHFRDFDVSDDLSHISGLHPEPFSSAVLSFRFRVRF
jgi:hypothetical protein